MAKKKAVEKAVEKPKMTDMQIETMLLHVIEHLDYDYYLSFLEHSDDPEGAAELMEELIEIAKKHLVG